MSRVELPDENMTPFHAMIHTFVQAFDPTLAVVLADALDEREIGELADQLRYWASHERISLSGLYQTGFPSFYGQVLHLAAMAGVKFEERDTYEWLSRGSTKPKAAPKTCGLQWRSNSPSLRSTDHPEFYARKDNLYASRQRTRMGFFRICTQPKNHRGDHVDGRDLLALVPEPLPGTRTLTRSEANGSPSR